MFWCQSFCLSLVSALERAFTQRTALARVDKVPVPTARPSRSPFMPFCFFFSAMNSSFGLLSSQLPCSRCSCRRCLLPPRRDTHGGERQGGERGKNEIKHRDQLICTVINREETLQRSARRGVNPGVLPLNAPTWQGPFIWLMDYILRVWSLLKHPAQKEVGGGGLRDRPARQIQTYDKVKCKESTHFPRFLVSSMRFITFQDCFVCTISRKNRITIPFCLTCHIFNNFLLE